MMRILPRLRFNNRESERRKIHDALNTLAANDALLQASVGPFHSFDGTIYSATAPHNCSEDRS